MPWLTHCFDLALRSCRRSKAPTALGMAGIGTAFEPELARLARLDTSLFLLTVLVAATASLIAALYPSWRAAQVQPAWQLKSNG